MRRPKPHHDLAREAWGELNALGKDLPVGLRVRKSWEQARALSVRGRAEAADKIARSLPAEYLTQVTRVQPLARTDDTQVLLGESFALADVLHDKQ